MSLYKNLNDIPFQFRRYENKDNRDNMENKDNNTSENIKGNINDKSISIESKELNIKKEDIENINIFEKKDANVSTSNFQMSKKDRLFILLILAIFFDVI